ncbi:hypothetical protein ACFWBR_31335 [Streptomyces sp. NPDC060006]|uniref:hypothetical protein n=1 Tax=unclassified Streptomyces TaxID=2593676 RepID=UPI0036C954B2
MSHTAATALPSVYPPQPDPELAERIVGTWLEKFTVEGKEYQSVLHFTRDGHVFILAGPYPGGGAGFWTGTGELEFTMRMTEFVIDESGTYKGRVDIDHHAVLTGTGFLSKGMSAVFDAHDQLTVSMPIEASAERI